MGTFSAGGRLFASVLDDVTVQVVTSGTHPGATQGVPIYETDTGAFAVGNGTGFSYVSIEIGSQVLNATTASVTFSGIPAVTRLMAFFRVRSSASGPSDVLMRLDGVSGSNYLWAKNEASSGTQSDSHATTPGTSAKVGISDAGTASFSGNGSTTIDGWGSTTNFATWAGVYGNFTNATGTDWAGVATGLFNASVGPHTSLTFMLSSGSFAAGSQFSVYGVM